MRFAAGPPTKWLVTLPGGQTVEVWADGVSEEEGFFVFSILVDATVEEQQLLDVTGRTPSNVARVQVTVARFPVSSIEDPRGT